MNTCNVIQGSEEWHRLRIAADFTASEAPMIMGASKKLSRAAWLRMRATGGQQEFSQWMQENILDRGHEIEALARPLVEAQIGEDLYPVTGAREVDGLVLLASFDGLTMLEDRAWECKSWNAGKVADVSYDRLPEEDKWQVVFQSVLSRAPVLYTVSDGTEENLLTMEYHLRPEDENALLAGLHQAKEDLSNYQHDEVIVEAQASPQEHLPAVAVQVHGALQVRDNLPAFGEALSAYIRRLNLKPQTDQDFADLEAACKSLKTAEHALQGAEDNALAQTGGIEELRRTIAGYREQARQTRLQAEKVVKAEKENRRAAIHGEAVEVIRKHYDAINETLIGASLPMPADAPQEIARAMKGKKTIQSWKDASADAATKLKISANERADEVRRSIAHLDAVPDEYRALFGDRQALAMSPAEHVEMVVKARIADHKEEERKRIEAEREKIRREEEARAQAEIDRARREEGARMEAERERIRGEEEAPRRHPENEETDRMDEDSAANQKATLKLGDIRDRLGFALSASFIADTLGINPAATERRAVLYRESQWPMVCRALAQHVAECERAGKI